jgi:hypothetical protein
MGESWETELAMGSGKGLGVNNETGESGKAVTELAEVTSLVPDVANASGKALTELAEMTSVRTDGANGNVAAASEFCEEEPADDVLKRSSFKQTFKLPFKLSSFK